MSQCSPYTSLLAILLYQTNIVICKLSKLLNQFGCFIGIFIRTHMYPFTTEYWLVTLQIFFKQGVYKRIGLRWEQIQMIHTILLTTYFGFITWKCQRMCRNIDLRNNFNPQCHCLFLQIDKFFLGIKTVIGRQSGIHIRFQPKSRISIRKVIIEEFFVSVIIQMNLQSIHLVVRHDFNQIL